MPARRPEYRPVSLSASHWRSDGTPKMRFATRRDAREAAEMRSAEAGVALATYQCDFCGGWHMGRPSEPPPDRRPSGTRRRRG